MHTQLTIRNFKRFQVADIELGEMVVLPVVEDLDPS
jgi:hypothetical protein